MDFTCLVAEKRKFDHARYSSGDGETTFQKLMYQTFMAVLRKYEHPEVLRIFHAHRTSPVPMSDLHRIFNSGAMRDYGLGLKFYRPLRQMEHMPVSKSPLHQMADLLLGAVSWQWNKSRRGDDHSPKGRIASYVQSESPHDRLDKPSSRCPQFHIWEFKLRGPRA